MDQDFQASWMCLHLSTSGLVWGLGFTDQVTEPLGISTVAPGMKTLDF